MTRRARQERFRVKRVFNNSAVLAVGVDQTESVLLGKGIGFHLHPGDKVDPALVDRTFVLTDQDWITRYTTLLEEVSDEEIDLARDVMIRARRELGDHIKLVVLLPLVDHLSFAIRRAREHAKPLDYELKWEVKHLYPEEVKFSQWVLEEIWNRMGVRVPAEEAVPISLHFVNARLASEDMGTTIRTTRMLGQILIEVQEAFQIDIDEESVDVARLVSHLRYLSGGKLSLAPVPESVQAAVRSAQPAEYAVAERIASILELEAGIPIHDQEKIYLTLHINRLRVASEERTRVQDAD